MKAIRIISMIYGIMNAINNGMTFLSTLMNDSSQSEYGSGEFFESIEKVTNAYYDAFFVLSPFMVFIGFSFYYGAKIFLIDFIKAKNILTAASLLSLVWFVGYAYRMLDVADQFNNISFLDEGFSGVMYFAIVLGGGVWYCGFPVFLLIWFSKKKANVENQT